MTHAQILRWISGGLEAFLGIPILGGLFIISTGYTPLIVMFVVHLVTLVLSANNREPVYGSILGIITSVIAWLPIIGMIMHLITAAFLMFSATKKPSPPSIDGNHFS